MNRVRWVILASICSLTWIPPSSQLDCGLRIPFDQDSNETPKDEKTPQTMQNLDTQPGQWPWTVSLQLNNNHFCTGSILSASWILTAAHCFDDVNINDVQVQAGVTTLGKETGTLHKIEKLYKHEKFSHFPAENDIALLLLSSRIENNKLTTPICLPSANSFRIEDWRSCYVTGWGIRAAGVTRNSDILQNAVMKLMDMNKCKDWVWTANNKMLCADYDQGVRSAYQVDSGGPLVCRNAQDKTWFQLGIASWSKGCARKNTPGIYTLIPNYGNWIQDKTKNIGPPGDRPIVPNTSSAFPMHAFFMHQYLFIFVMVLQVTRAVYSFLL